MSCDSETDEKSPRLPPLKKKRRNRSFLPKIFSPFKRTPKKNSVTPADQQITYCKKDFESGIPPKIEICTAINDSHSIKSKSNSIRSFISGSIISEDWNPLNGLQYNMNTKLNGISPSPLNSPLTVRIHSPRSNGRSPSIGSQSLNLPVRRDRANSNISIFTEEDIPTLRSGAYMPGFARNRFK